MLVRSVTESSENMAASQLKYMVELTSFLFLNLTEANGDKLLER